jgi:hypothetical protein
MTIRASFKKKAPPILFGKNSRPADSFISENEGMNQALVGFSPLRMRSTKDAERRVMSALLVP